MYRQKRNRTIISLQLCGSKIEMGKNEGKEGERRRGQKGEGEGTFTREREKEG